MPSYPCGLCVLWSPGTTRSRGTVIDLLWFMWSWAVGRTVTLLGGGLDEASSLIASGVRPAALF